MTEKMPGDVGLPRDYDADVFFDKSSPVPIGRINIAISMIMNEAIARAHKENGLGYTSMSRLMVIMMDINEDVTRGVNERMTKMLQGEFNRAKSQRERMERSTTS